MTHEPGSEAGASSSVATQAADLWAQRDLPLNPVARKAAAGTATDWGLGGAAVPSQRPPIALAGGLPDAATLPRPQLLAALRRALDTADDEALRYGGPAGYEPLRAEIGRRFAGMPGLTLPPEHFMLTNGAAGAIQSVCAALVSPGDVILAEAPTFTGSLRTFRGHGAEVIGVPMDRDGIDTDAVARTIDRLTHDGRRVRLIYTTATYHNPTGVTMSEARREALVRIAAERGVFILEDTAYAAISFRDPPPPSLAAIADGHGVISAGTFSKTVATGLRVGWVQARPEMITALIGMRFDMGGSPILHRMVLEFIASGDFDRHLHGMRTLYAAKARVLMDSLREYAEPYLSFTEPSGGFFLWARLQPGLAAATVQRAAVEEGVTFPVGRAFYPDGDSGLDGEVVRLCWSWVDEASLREGAARLARACARVASDPGR